MTFGRKDYEQQGAEILSTGIEAFCSADAIIEVVIRMARDNSRRFASILDVGCGAYPSYTREIAAMGKRVHGVDFTFNYLRLAQRSSRNMKFAQADATQLPYRDAAFDAAICSETAEHIPDDHAVVQEIARVLKPGGLLFFTVPNLWNASRIIEMIKARDSRVRLFEQHLREYSPRQVHRLLSPWFTVERSYPVGFKWTGPLGGPIDKMVRLGLLRRFSASIAVVGRRHPSATRA
jgi:ubiquinone/menaquinone biosynthesis C-methylase UbiE